MVDSTGDYFSYDKYKKTMQTADRRLSWKKRRHIKKLQEQKLKSEQRTFFFLKSAL